MNTHWWVWPLSCKRTHTPLSAAQQLDSRLSDQLRLDNNYNKTTPACCSMSCVEWWTARHTHNYTILLTSQCNDPTGQWLVDNNELLYWDKSWLDRQLACLLVSTPKTISTHNQPARPLVIYHLTTTSVARPPPFPLFNPPPALLASTTMFVCYHHIHLYLAHYLKLNWLIIVYKQMLNIHTPLISTTVY